MFKADGQTYLAYSGKFARNSPQVRLLKRAWESLRRNTGFREDFATISSSDPSQVDLLKDRFRKRWGVAVLDPSKSFDEIAENEDPMQLDAPDKFDDMYRRLYGDSFYGEDRVVQCEQFNVMYGLLSEDQFEWLSGVARGQIRYNAPTETLQRNAPDDPKVSLTIDVDENPIAILYKVQFIIRALRTARIKAGKAESIGGRVEQQLQTLEEKLDANIVGDGERRDFRHDDEVFRVWDLAQAGRTHEEIARTVWRNERGEAEGVRDVAGDRTRIGQRVYRYKSRAEEWIAFYPGRIKNDTVTVL